MLWNHDGDEPLMTRRRFFFLTGMAGAFVVAQQTGLVALAERAAPVVIPKRVMSASIGLDSILKEIYLPAIREQMRRNNVFLEALRKEEHELSTMRLVTAVGNGATLV